MSEDITIKKATFKKLIFGIAASLIAVAFFAGYVLGSQTGQPLVIQENPQKKKRHPATNSRSANRKEQNFCFII